MTEIRAATDLIVYQKAYALSMEIFRLSKDWPPEEKYSLWLDFARDCGYLAPTDYTRLAYLCREVGSMLGAMLFDPTPFLLKLS